MDIWKLFSSKSLKEQLVLAGSLDAWDRHK
jgi:hypothetical protein